MLTDKVIRTAFIISLTGHCLLLSIPGINIISPPLNKPEDVTIRIEIERPPLLPKIDVMGQEKKLKEVIEKPKPEFKSEPKQEVVVEQSLKKPIEQDIKIIDPAQEAMLRYQDMVKQRIEQVRRYPPWAKRQGIEGEVYLSFIVSSNGLGRNIKIIYPSGYKILDEEAVATIQRANPFPPIPKEIKSHWVQMEVSIVFTLK